MSEGRATLNGLVWTEEASQDLTAISVCISREDPQAASQVIKALISTIGKLENAPTAGKVGRIPGTRELVLGGGAYTIAFRVKDTRIEILRLIHVV
ncbi:MAG: type II toxin-antitoxin system RelE/ParE family toxin [Alphaproteobacteria bacterium]